MELYYNDVALHDLGTLTVGGQTFEPFPAAAPQRTRVNLRVRIDSTLDGFRANRDQLEAVREALSTQHAELRWADGEVEYLRRTATVGQHNFPDDPNAWGTYHQALEISFEYFETIGEPNALAMTFTKTGGTTFALGQVHGWRRRYSATRYSKLRSHRSGGEGGIFASGQLVPDPATPLATRRSALQTLVNQLLAAVNGADGRLVYTPFFDKTVRIEEFNAQVDQAAHHIDWSLSAAFTEFPNEAGYALAEFEIRTRTSKEDGRYLTVFSGRIGAQSETAAQAKLATLRAGLSAGLPAGRTLRALDSETRIVKVEADADGVAFLELHFNETYEGKLVNGDVSARYAFRVQDDYVQRRRFTTLSGFIHAHTRANADTALAQILAGLSVTGQKVSSERSEERGRYWGNLGTTADDVPEYLVKVDFTDQWETGLAGADLIIESEVSEEIQFSGPRYVAQPTAFGRDVVQACGIQSGRRVVTGRCRAASEASARDWALRQYHLPKAAGLPDLPVPRYRRPPQLVLSASFPLLTDGVARTSDDPEFNPEELAANVPTWEARFGYEELLTDYDWPG